MAQAIVNVTLDEKQREEIVNELKDRVQAVLDGEREKTDADHA